MRMVYLILALAAAAVGLPSAADGRVWYIRADHTGDAPTIQAALDLASSGDDIVLGAGVYSWTSQNATGETMISLKTGVNLRSKYGPESTVIDAERRGRAIRCEDVGDVRIEGLTITRGFRDVRAPDGFGGGIYSTGTSRPTIANCILQDNWVQLANLGGAIACVDMGATITACQIVDNLAAYEATAAGIYIRNGVVAQCTFRGNVNTGDGANAGGMLAVDSVVEDCRFEGNRCVAISGAIGGGLLVSGGTVTRCVFVDNVVQANPFAYAAGGAIYCGGDVTIAASVFLRNRVISVGYPGEGGAISTTVAQPTIRGCTFLGNAASGPARPTGGLYLPLGGTVTATIIAWTEGAPCTGPITMSCTDLYGNTLGDAICGIDAGGNLSADPLFCAIDPITTGNVGIRASSPCAPGASAGCELIGAGDVACKTVPVRQATWGQIKTRYR